MQCAKCEKTIYGHSYSSRQGPIVCGSCTLTKLGNTGNHKASKDLYQVRFDLAKLAAGAVRHEDFSMAVAVVRSNYARNKTVLLDGRYPLTFDATGRALCPVHLSAALEREMDSRPGRYWYESALETTIPSVPSAPVIEAAVEQKLEEKSSLPVVQEEEQPKKTPTKGKQKK
jgi:hypothetical protein